jgi:CheY-like chemotaxis protein
MRLDQMTPAHVRRAVDVYVRHAFPVGISTKPRITSADLTGAVTMEQLFERMDRLRATDVEGCRRYSLQIGNHLYPFMKLVLEEYLVNGEYFFAADTHDNLDIRPEHPDYGAFQTLKDHNRALKLEIESAWRVAGLPTLDDLRVLCQDLSELEREENKGARILLVEDDLAVAFAIRTWLVGKGYQVEIADTGEATLERLTREPLPDLVVLDYELPGLDGECVLNRIRAEGRLSSLPILMATAAKIDLSRLSRVNGVLHKPYPRELLIATIRRLLPAAAHT